MKSSHLREIREILEDAFLGKFDHNQNYWFCGTSRCIAGRKLSIDAAKRASSSSNLDLQKEEDYGFSEAACALVEEILGESTTALFRAMHLSGEYAKEIWGLTHHERCILFATTAKFSQQFALLEVLESGVRVGDGGISRRRFEKFHLRYLRRIKTEGEDVVFLKPRQELPEREIIHEILIQRHEEV